MDPDLAPEQAAGALPDAPARAPDLKAPPLAGLEVIRRALDPKSCAGDIEGVVRSDAALTQRLLRIANSAFYRRGYPIQTVREAVVHLGFHELRRVALTTSVQDFMHGGFAPGFDRHGFFVHCLAVASLSQALSESLGHEDPPVAFAAGLLHDIGKNFFDQHYPEPFGKALRWAAGSGTTLVEAERHVFTRDVHPRLRDHAAMGRWALQAWELPATFVEVAGRHHDEPGSGADFLVQVVQCADVLAQNLGLGSSGNGAVPDWHDQFGALGLSAMDLVDAIGEGVKTAQRMSEVAGETLDIAGVEVFCAGVVAEPSEGDGDEDDLRVGHG